MPDFLQDPLLVKSSTWTMSTSQIYGLHFETYGWGSVDPKGHGLAYLIQPGKLDIVASRIEQFNCFVADFLQFTFTSKVGLPNKEVSFA